jgi:hypothetical protein
MAPDLLEPLDPRPPRPSRLSALLQRPARMRPPAPDPTDIIPPGKRRKAMSGINDVEAKWSTAGLVIAVGMSVFLPIYAKEFLHSATDKSSSVTSEAVLLGGVILFFCLIGLYGLIRRKRTLLAFCFFIIGLAFLLTFGPLGFGFILLGGWLMLRAYRIQKYGTANARQVAREAAARPPRRERKAAASAPATPTGHKPPTRNKRYTP